MKIEKILDKNNNNIDLLRLIAAVMVIYGHAFAITPKGDNVDFIWKILKFDYSGSLAVKAFFFLSGLVVANSLFAKRNLLAFAVGRLFRIIPGLLAVLLVTAFVIGPLTSKFSVPEYFASPAAYEYVAKNLLFKTEYFLPGVFEENQYPKAVNGSLWTLSHEVGLYVSFGALFVVGVFRYKLVALIVFAIIIIDPIVGNKLVFTWRQPNIEIDYLLPSFAIGVLLASMKDKLEVNATTVVALFILYYLLKDSIWGITLFYVFFFIMILYVASLPLFVRCKPSLDLSYGVYLWGFPIQQLVYYYYPHQTLFPNIGISILICILLSVILYLYVEKPGMKMGQKLVNYAGGGS